MESCGLEKTSEIIRSNHQPSTTPVFHTKPHQVPVLNPSRVGEGLAIVPLLSLPRIEPPVPPQCNEQCPFRDCS